MHGSETKMTHSFTRKQLGLAIACALALGFVSNAARSETLIADKAYLTESRGGVVMNNYGECWHSDFGPPSISPACNPNYVPAPVALVAAAPQAEVAPAPAPAPAPVAVVQPKPRAVVRVTLDADMLFDFDKANLRAEGAVALDDFIRQSKDISPETMMAVGHADRLGSDAYNQRLSEQRVQSVKAYMLSKGITSNYIHTEGKGETQPVTKAGECDGAKSTKVIACLQPDRRVDLEVIGTRLER